MPHIKDTFHQGMPLLTTPLATNSRKWKKEEGKKKKSEGRRRQNSPSLTIHLSQMWFHTYLSIFIIISLISFFSLYLHLFHFMQQEIHLHLFVLLSCKISSPSLTLILLFLLCEFPNPNSNSAIISCPLQIIQRITVFAIMVPLRSMQRTPLP